MKIIFKIRPLYYCVSKKYKNWKEHYIVFTRADGSVEDLIVDSRAYHSSLHPAFTEYKHLIKKL